MPTPKILWGSSFANTLNVYVFDNPTSYTKNRDGSINAQAPSGVEDSWTTGKDYYQEIDIRWIPPNDQASPAATGWNGTTGVDAFISWAMDSNQFRWYPDNTSGTFILSYLVPTAAPTPSLESNGTKRIRLVMRNGSTQYTGF